MDIYQHFRKVEEPFIDQVVFWKEQVERNYIPKLTDFLDPREQQILQMVIGAQNEVIKLLASGGYRHAERKRMIIAPFYEEVEEEDFQLSLLEATYDKKFITLTHRDVMGAFLSLGIKREKLGDIFAEDGLIQMIVAKEISPYVMMNLTSVKNAKTTFHEKPFEQIRIPEPNWVESNQTVSSLRLDNVIKEIYRMSRKDAQMAVEKQLVKVNHKVVEDSKFQIEEGDLLSVRGKGRSKLIKIEGQTRKDKFRIRTAILK